MRVLRKIVEENDFWSSLPLHKLGDESIVLSTLVKEGRPMTLAEIAKKTGLSPRRASRAVDALESRGLVITNRGFKYHEQPDEYVRVFGKPPRRVGRPPLVTRGLVREDKEMKDLSKRIRRNKNTVSSYFR